MWRPIQLIPVGEAVDLTRESVGEREISAGVAATVSVAALLRKCRKPVAKRRGGGFSLLL